MSLDQGSVFLMKAPVLSPIEKNTLPPSLDAKSTDVHSWQCPTNMNVLNVVLVTCHSPEPSQAFLRPSLLSFWALYGGRRMQVARNLILRTFKCMVEDGPTGRLAAGPANHQLL